MDPKCPYFGKCGGCNTQHIEYSAQLGNKKKNIASLLKIDEGRINVFSDKEYFYRNRMDFIFHREGLGFREKGNWKRIINVDECVISDERINELLKEIKDFFKDVDVFDLIKQKGTYRYAVIRTPGETSSISFILNDDSQQKEDAVEKIREFAKITICENIIVGFVSAKSDMSITDNIMVIKGSEFLREKILGKTLTYHSQAFFQNNSRMAERMIEYTYNLFEKTQCSLLDLYGGVGSFGVSLADKFEDVTIIEAVQGSIDSANENIKLNGIKNATAQVLDAKSINRLKFHRDLYVITDPPRSGMAPKAVERLIHLRPKKIIYVSCNPQQLAKELLRFLKLYDLKSIAIFDLFPQTNHCEVVVELDYNLD